jgi:hypothetical protein
MLWAISHRNELQREAGLLKISMKPLLLAALTTGAYRRQPEMIQTREEFDTSDSPLRER